MREMHENMGMRGGNGGGGLPVGRRGAEDVPRGEDVRLRLLQGETWDRRVTCPPILFPMLFSSIPVSEQAVVVH